MSNGFIPRRKPTISIDPKRMGSFDRIGAVPSSRGGGGGVGRLRDLLLSSWGHHFSHHIDGKGSRSVALLAAALVVTVLVCFGMFARGGGNGEPRHVVVFDAGSTGNRVHVFEFDTTGDGPRLKQEVFHAAKPGLKERAEDPRAAAALLDPLVATAMRSVPARARKRTPLTLRATAGLRLLPEGPAAADAIMDAVRSKLSRTGFDVKSRDVSILSGGDEGLYGWVAVNYLLGRIGGGGAGEVGSEKKTTVALADLGGGSAQLSYAVDADVASTAPAGYVRTVPGTRGPAGALSAYVHSFNGYGLVAARHRILAGVGGGAWAAKPSGARRVGERYPRQPPSSRTHACVHAGHAGHSCDRDCYGLDDKTMSYSVTPAKDGGSFAGCVEAALDAIDAEKGCEHAPCSFGGAWRRHEQLGSPSFTPCRTSPSARCSAAPRPFRWTTRRRRRRRRGGSPRRGRTRARRAWTNWAPSTRRSMRSTGRGSARTWRTCTRC